MASTFFSTRRVVYTVVTLVGATAALAALIPLTMEDFRLSGTQVGDVPSGVLETSDTCRTCHGDFDPEDEPYSTWAGSLMGLAGRDPLFYAQMTNANQDVANVGNFCLRCHVPMSIVTGHVVDPTGGSARRHGSRRRDLPLLPQHGRPDLRRRGRAHRRTNRSSPISTPCPPTTATRCSCSTPRADAAGPTTTPPPPLTRRSPRPSCAAARCAAPATTSATSRFRAGRTARGATTRSTRRYPTRTRGRSSRSSEPTRSGSSARSRPAVSISAAASAGRAGRWSRPARTATCRRPPRAAVSSVRSEPTSPATSSPAPPLRPST